MSDGEYWRGYWIGKGEGKTRMRELASELRAAYYKDNNDLYENQSDYDEEKVNAVIAKLEKDE